MDRISSQGDCHVLVRFLRECLVIWAAFAVRVPSVLSQACMTNGSFSLCPGLYLMPDNTSSTAKLPGFNLTCYSNAVTGDLSRATISKIGEGSRDEIFAFRVYAPWKYMEHGYLPKIPERSRLYSGSDYFLISFHAPYPEEVTSLYECTINYTSPAPNNKVSTASWRQRLRVQPESAFLSLQLVPEKDSYCQNGSVTIVCSANAKDPDYPQRDPISFEYRLAADGQWQALASRDGNNKANGSSSANITLTSGLGNVTQGPTVRCTVTYWTAQRKNMTLQRERSFKLSVCNGTVEGDGITKYLDQLTHDPLIIALIVSGVAALFILMGLLVVSRRCQKKQPTPRIIIMRQGPPSRRPSLPTASRSSSFASRRSSLPTQRSLLMVPSSAGLPPSLSSQEDSVVDADETSVDSSYVSYYDR